jgi:cobalt/nickel transport system permease protein
MHIPDAYLSPATQATAAAVMTPFWVIAAKKTKASLSARQVPLLSIGAAFAFAIQMFNIPAVGGTTAHALGTALLAILLGPWAAIVAMTLSLAVQAFFFGDGGILSLGANCFDMAVVCAFVTYGVYRFLIVRSKPGSLQQLTAAAIAAYLGTATASLSAGLILGAQPLIAHDAAGHALYFPFGWAVSVPAMVNIHLSIAAPAEAVITCAALAYLWRNFPDLVRTNSRVRVQTPLRLGRVLAFVLILTPLGLLASGNGWGEWDASSLKQMIGYVPSGVAHSKGIINPLMPDYALSGHEGKPWEIIGYLISALLGTLLIIGTLRALTRKQKATAYREPEKAGPNGVLPAWLSVPNNIAPQKHRRTRSWLDGTLVQMRDTIAKTNMGQQSAENQGFLQAAPALSKLLITVVGLVLVSLVHSSALLTVVLAALLTTAAVSRLSVGRFAKRVVLTAAFFGLILAVPLALRSVSPGPIAITVLGIKLSQPGLLQGLQLLLRLSCGIGFALLLTSTTTQTQLVGALRRLRLPTLFVTGLMLTYRYVFAIMDTMSEMVTARKSRQVGCITREQARLYSGSASAVLFAKSMAFSEESYQAMRSRLADFHPEVKNTKTKKVVNWVWATCLAAAVATVLFTGLIHAF